MSASPSAAPSLKELHAAIVRHWGIHSLRPLQEPAMKAVLSGRDSLVVLPTGAGKSLCYQAPAAIRANTTVVVSPLIALMKDQVDGLRASGVAAAQIDSSLSRDEQQAFEDDLRQGNLRLAFVSPERLAMPGFQRLLQQIDVRAFAIDEAHCISHWGHDFRPEYRQLNRLKELYPHASVHAYTATATERVRQDIVRQLNLQNPEILVGSFDRPNLTYRVVPRAKDLLTQVVEVLKRHPGEAGIIYCIRRKDVDELTGALNQSGYRAVPYHAGMSAEERTAAQEAFINEECDLVVATVAFGMGIDRSNLRFVLHTGMPKSVEHYQQEAGRAGRDGLEAECVLLHAGKDFMTWKYIIEKSAEEAAARGEPVDPTFVPEAMRHLDDMMRYCRTTGCRHRSLVEYFGQEFEQANCGACDLCLEGVEVEPDSLVIAQKILSCVARVRESFGVGHVTDVLVGSQNAKVKKYGHDRLTTHGLLREHGEAQTRAWIDELIDQKCLTVQRNETFSLLKLTPASWEVMRGQREVRLTKAPKAERARKSKADTVSWEGVDRELFDALRELRRQIAEEKQVPPYVVFSDATLRELARSRPSTPERMRLVYGVGEMKLREFGERFLERIARYCRQNGVALDNTAGPPPAAPPAPREGPSLNARAAFPLFQRGASIPDVMQRLGRARSTVAEYLCEFIRTERPASVEAWVDDGRYQQVVTAARRVGTGRLRPIFVALGEQVPYDDIRVVLTHLRTAEGDEPPAAEADF
jgi:ATP-dependent DNA helicase RecQ